MQNFGVRLETKSTALIGKSIEILRRVLRERADRELTERPDADAVLTLGLEPGIGREGFRIEGAPGGNVRILGNDERGLLYGIGKFLHTSQYTASGFSPSTWRGVSIPDCSMRGIYFANNFGNWNCACPVAELKQYLEELALWGMNTASFYFGISSNLQEPGRSKYLARNHELIRHADALGMKVVLLYGPNSGLGKIPKAIQAKPFPDANPARRGAGDNPCDFVCPSNPEGHAFIMERFGAEFDKYRGLPIYAVATFPYDAGGCGCPDCWPWGARGFPALSRDFIELARQRFAGCKLILCTWCYDVLEKPDGEYEGLAKLLKEQPGLCDMIMTDAHGSFPEYPLKHGVPGGLPMINFAEISMWGRYPWGGSGANPFPKRMVTIWNQAKHLLDGGLPYSEGRFEDINKVTCLSLFWDKQAAAAAIVRDYVNFEYGAAALPALTQTIDIMEDIYPHDNLTAQAAAKAFQLIQEGERQLAPGAGTRWRWRILRARAIIDHESTLSPEIVTVARNDAYEELTRIYCAQRAGNPVAPRAESYYQRSDVAEKGPVYASHIGENASNPDRIK